MVKGAPRIVLVGILLMMIGILLENYPMKTLAFFLFILGLYFDIINSWEEEIGS